MKKNNKIKILTPSGFRNFNGIEKLIKPTYLKISVSSGGIITCSPNHVLIQNQKEVFARDLKLLDVLDTMYGNTVITDIKSYDEQIELFDVIGVDGGNLFTIDNGIISHNCDASFVSSGNTVIDPELLQFYRDSFCQPPVEKTGFDGNLWKWEYPDYTKSYMVIADVARGDGPDNSACHVIEVESATQVAEYRGKIGTKEFGNFLVSLATDYNEALLVVENANIGWAVLQQIIDREYKNTFYMSKDLKYVDTSQQMNNRYRAQDKGMVAGFSTTLKTRPLIISKLDTYFREKSVTIRSTRTIDELDVFIWNNNKAEAMRGYNDDLVMSLSIGLWVRDTALRLRQEGIDLTLQALDGISTATVESGFYGGSSMANEDTGWTMNVNGESEDLTWLI